MEGGTAYQNFIALLIPFVTFYKASKQHIETHFSFVPCSFCRLSQGTTRCVCETWMPLVATKSTFSIITKSFIITPPLPQGHVVSVKCEQPLDEVQVWLLYLNSNLKYCTLYRSEGIRILYTGKISPRFIFAL